MSLKKFRLSKEPSQTVSFKSGVVFSECGKVYILKHVVKSLEVALISLGQA